jgi:gamma-carbonic anhydrase
MDQNGLDPASLYERQVIPYRGVSPRLHSTVFIAPGAYIIGNVTIGENSSVWFNAVIRGDVHYIEIGAGVNIQDLCMLHVTHDTYPLTVGNEVTVGHGAVLHGCTVSDNVLVGMRATVLDGATIGSYSLIAAGSLVREGFVVPEGVLVAGVPARIIRELREEERRGLLQSAKNYINYVRAYTDE